MLENNGSDTSFDIEKVVISGFKCIREPLTVDVTRPLSILVGDNGVGKSSILEAIHLALTGMYRGEPIRRALSEDLFNSAAIDAFIRDAGAGRMSELPSICIEVFLRGGKDQDAELLSGAVNSERAKRCGFTFAVKFDEEYRTELSSLSLDNLKSLPIEYYDFGWTTFADAQITPRKIPVRSVLINPAGEWHSSRADAQATRLLVDGLNKKQQMTLAQDARVALDGWDAKKSLKDANGSLPDIGISSFGAIDIATDRGTAESWKRNITVRLGSVPYGHIGSGVQSVMQAAIALKKERPDKPTLLLFEEPENHLSHTNLNLLIKLISDGADGRKIVLTTHSNYVANVLGLENILIVGGDKITCTPLSGLRHDTLGYFKKLPGYDTLRLVLARAVILVEGPSDELIVQLAYRNSHNGRLPIEDGIDVVSVGSGFLRFLELASVVERRVLVLTDNDDNPEAVAKKYDAYSDCDFIKISYVKDVYRPSAEDGDDPKLGLNWNTLEAEMLRANGFERVESLLGRSKDSSNATLLKYMESNKTDTACKFFDAGSSVSIPSYIADGIGWLDGRH